MEATYTFRIGLASSRPPREDRERFVTLLGEDSHRGMRDAELIAIAMAMGSTSCSMATSSKLLQCEL